MPQRASWPADDARAAGPRGSKPVLDHAQQPFAQRAALDRRGAAQRPVDDQQRHAVHRRPGQVVGARAPLGRPRAANRTLDSNTRDTVPDAIDAQRARRVLEELRRRFGDAARPRLELDYLERLLRDY